MRRVRRYAYPAFAGLAAIAALLAIRILAPAPFERLQLLAFDTLQRAAPWTPAQSDVVVVDIDDASLARLGQWPWPRNIVAKLVRALQDRGARSIAFDVVFAEPDRTSPHTQAKAWHDFGWTASPAGGAQLPDWDEELAAAFARGKVVTGFGLLAAANGAVPDPAPGFATIGGDPAATVQAFSGAVPNLPLLAAAAAGHGSFAITAAHDQTIRRLPLLLAFDGKPVPALALEALRVAEDEDTIRVRAEREAGTAGPVTGYTVRIGDYDVPTAADGTLVLHHGPWPTSATIPAWRVLDAGERHGAQGPIAGRIALIGTSAIGLADLRATPLDPLEPGVRMHARALQQILSRHFLSRPAWAQGAELMAAAVAAVLMILVVTFLGVRAAVACVVLAVAAALGGAWKAFTAAGLLFDPSLVVLAFLVSGVAAGLARYLMVERDAAKLRLAFMHYLSPSLVDALARNPDSLELGGQLREMTFLFTDLEGFTALVESSDPHAIVGLLNAYLDGLCAIAMEHGGTIDKIVGDALHVMFNAPVDQPDHAARAVRCALAMDAFAEDFRVRQNAAGIGFGVTRIGVNSGPAVVGNFGGSRRFDYTAHGDAINTAARLEAANKSLGTRICVARATMEQVSDVTFLPVGTLMLKGKARGVEVFLPLADAPAAAADWTTDYRDAFARMLAGDAGGAAALLALEERFPGHPILALHARRIRAGRPSVLMAA